MLLQITAFVVTRVDTATAPPVAMVGGSSGHIGHQSPVTRSRWTTA